MFCFLQYLILPLQIYINQILLKMNLLSTNAVVSLQKQSDNELDIFTNTVKRIESINTKIIFQKKSRNDQVLKLQEELKSLEVIESKNKRTISKIQSFLD